MAVWAHYTALGPDTLQCRILVLAAGHPSDPLDGCFRIVSLDDKPKPEYETISYVWGDANTRGSMTLNGREISIPMSSVEALRRVRLIDADRVLWIDAVCINQQDRPERSQQVTMMGRIFSQSQGNLIYLSGEDERCGDAVRFVAAVNKAIMEETDQLRDKDATRRLVSVTGMWEAIPACGVDYDTWKWLVNLPWFRRVWVFQEAALAPLNTCFVGRWTVPLVDILHAQQRLLACYQTCLDADGISPAHCNMLTALFSEVEPTLAEENGSPGLNSYLNLSLRLACSDPRDKVYGMLGIFQSHQDELHPVHSLLQPDYSKAIGHVFRDATRYIYQKCGVLAYGLDCRHASLERLDQTCTPTWALDRTGDRHTSESDTWDFAPFSADVIGDFPRAGGVDVFPDRGICHAGDDENLLLTRGFVVGAIKSRTAALVPRHESRDLALHTWIRDVIDQAQEVVPPDQLLERVSRTLMAGEGVFQHSPSFNSVQQYLLSQTHIGGKHRAHDPVGSCNASDDHHDGNNIDWDFETLQQIRRKCTNLRFLTSDSHHIGLGEHLTDVGDVIAVLCGSDMPVVLRPDGAHYRLLARCYIEDHDIRLGEEMKRHIEGGRPLAEFVLR